MIFLFLIPHFLMLFPPVKARTHTGILEHTDIFVKSHTSAGALYVLAFKVKPNVTVFGNMSKNRYCPFYVLVSQ